MVGVDYNIGIRMQDYEKAVEGLLKVKPRQPAKQEDLQAIHAASTEIMGALKASHKAICEKDQQGTLTRRLLSRLVGSTLPELTALLREILEVLYLKDSPLLLTAVYPSYPALLRRFIEAQETKGAELDQLLRVVSANEAGRHNRFLRDREEAHTLPFARDLYAIHFGKPRPDPEAQQEKSLQLEESQSANTDKRAIKSILLCLIYRNLPLLDSAALQEYLHAIFVYCGGESAAYCASSFYLLQKRNAFNLFRYSISEQEIEWILLALYELSVQSNSLKFELLAAINMIYKKTANESMFRYSEIAQSVIHLLEDQYQDVFA